MPVTPAAVHLLLPPWPHLSLVVNRRRSDVGPVQQQRAHSHWTSPWTRVRLRQRSHASRRSSRQTLRDSRKVRTHEQVSCWHITSQDSASLQSTDYRHRHRHRTPDLAMPEAWPHRRWQTLATARPAMIPYRGQSCHSPHIIPRYAQIKRPTTFTHHTLIPTHATSHSHHITHSRTNTNKRVQMKSVDGNANDVDAQMQPRVTALLSLTRRLVLSTLPLQRRRLPPLK
jgi:hypothetical protein